MSFDSKKLSSVLAVFFTMLIISTPMSVNAEHRDFPLLHINSRLHPFEQEREFWHDGSLTLRSDNPEWNFSNVGVQLRGRGNATWWSGPHKRPLRIRFDTPQGMFGSYEHRDWILLANAFDGSLLRTHFTFYFASLLGDTTVYVPSTQFVHLYINGEYKGVYQLTDERDNGPGRGNVIVDSDPEVSEFWLEMDMRTTEYFNIHGLYYDIRMPSGSALTDDHVEYAHKFLLWVSDAIRSHDWERIITLIDVNSFVDFYIVQEWSKETDVAFSSVFMQILGQGNDRRLVMGPFWDFDNSFGNFDVVYNEPAGVFWAQRHYWFANLMQTQQFRDAVAKRWVETAWAREAALENLEYMARVYELAFSRNFEVQPMFASPWRESRSPLVLEAGSIWQNQVDFLADFARLRAKWLDENIAYQTRSRFFDLHMTFWYYDDVMKVYNSGIFDAWSPHEFAPMERVTLGMFTRALYNLSGGVVGVSVLNQEEAITREEMVVLLYNFALQQGIQLPYGRSVGFRDIYALSLNSQYAINVMHRASIVSGWGQGIFRPHNYATRAEAAVIIVRFMSLMDLPQV